MKSRDESFPWVNINNDHKSIDNRININELLTKIGNNLSFKNYIEIVEILKRFGYVKDM
jgi:hypothetical protein